MKAILVIDEMPDSCFHCPLESYRNQCGANHKNTAGNANKRPSWCPLNSLPSKELDDDGSTEWEIYYQGWIDCLDKIMGEIE